MDHDVQQRLDAQERKLDAIYKSVEQTRKMFLATVIVSVVAFVLPLVGLIFVIPWFLSVMGDAYKGLL